MSYSAEQVKKWRKNNPEKHAAQKRRYSLKKKYKISTKEYDDLFIKQSGRCAICTKETDRRLDVDHNHVTKEIRGLLCNQCNQGLGLFQDNPLILKAAYQYLGGVS